MALEENQEYSPKIIIRNGHTTNSWNLIELLKNAYPQASITNIGSFCYKHTSRPTYLFHHLAQYQYISLETIPPEVEDKLMREADFVIWCKS